MRSKTFRVMMVAAIAAIPIGVGVSSAHAGGFSCDPNSGWSSSNSSFAQPHGGAPNPCDTTTTTTQPCHTTTTTLPPVVVPPTVPVTTPPTEVTSTTMQEVTTTTQQTETSTTPTTVPQTTTPTTAVDNTPLPTVTTTTLVGKLVPPVTATSNPTSSTQPQTVQIGTGIHKQLAYTGVSLWLFFIGLCCLLAGAAFLIKMFWHRPAQCQSLRLK